jgi:hypothetical protein
MALDVGAIARRAQAIDDEEDAATRAAVEAGGSASEVADIPTRQ